MRGFLLLPALILTALGGCESSSFGASASAECLRKDGARVSPIYKDDDGASEFEFTWEDKTGGFDLIAGTLRFSSTSDAKRAFAYVEPHLLAESRRQRRPLGAFGERRRNVVLVWRSAPAAPKDRQRVTECLRQ